jgi:hypothetical protein
MRTASTREVGVVRDLLQIELLENQVVNDRTMRNPAVMKALDERVRELFDKYKSDHEGGGKKRK